MVDELRMLWVFCAGITIFDACVILVAFERADPENEGMQRK